MSKVSGYVSTLDGLIPGASPRYTVQPKHTQNSLISAPTYYHHPKLLRTKLFARNEKCLPRRGFPSSHSWRLRESRILLIDEREGGAVRGCRATYVVMCAVLGAGAGAGHRRGKPVSLAREVSYESREGRSARRRFK